MKHNSLMQLYQVGPDNLGDYSLSQLKNEYLWMVHWYEIDMYDGKGIAAMLTPDNQIEYLHLAHCSCYDPLDATPIKVPIEKFLMFDKFDEQIEGRPLSPSDYQYEAWIKVVSKVKELLQVPTKVSP